MAKPPFPFSMLYRKEANSRDRKSNIEKGEGGSIVEMRKEICVKYSNIPSVSTLLSPFVLCVEAQRQSRE